MNKIQQKKYELLYQSHVNALRRQGKAEKTIEGYARAVRRITEFFDLCPDCLNEQHIKNYFDSLIKTHSWSTVKIDRNGLQFFFKYVLNREWIWVDIVKPPSKKVLPDILTVKEIERVINATRELRYQAFILVTYSMGLRLGETLNLKIGDIDAERMRIHVRQGKGRKDRFVILPEATLDIMRLYWATHRNSLFIFPGGRTAALRSVSIQSMNRTGTHKALKAVVKSCRIYKSISTHSLRHCYGAHLVEEGLHLRAIQHEMGHEDPNTTALYTRLTKVAFQNTEDTINRLINRLKLILEVEV